MPPFADRLKLILLENLVPQDEASWKDPHSSEYDRQTAENALYYTIGPLTDAPKWAQDWTSPDGVAYQAGTPAPRWTQEEVAIAFAGDPKYMEVAGHPKSPRYGSMGGAPLWRTARQVAKVYARGQDQDFINEMYGNGYVQLVRMMQPGHDESRSAFIPWVIRSVKGAMEHGIGGTEETNLALGERSKRVEGLEALKKVTRPEDAERMANQVKGKYQTTRAHDKNPDNPFGQFSADYHRLATQLASALRTADEALASRTRQQIDQLQDRIRESNETLLGASTGAGQAISTPDRTTEIGIGSVDAPIGDNGETVAGNVAAASDEEDIVTPEAVYYVLEQALKYDFNEILGQDSKFIAPVLQRLHVDKVGGPLTVNEFRYVLRYLGPHGANYPGKGTPRKNVAKPRDVVGWWRAGEDPEIEPVPGRAVGEGQEEGEQLRGNLWQSIWTRKGHSTMGPVEIAREMTEEYFEFSELGIPSGRKANTKSKGGKQFTEVVSKVAVSNTMKQGMIKLAVAAEANKHTLDLGIRARQKRDPEQTASFESLRQRLGLPLCEDLNQADLYIITEVTNFLVAKALALLE